MDSGGTRLRARSPPRCDPRTDTGSSGSSSAVSRSPLLINPCVAAAARTVPAAVAALRVRLPAWTSSARRRRTRTVMAMDSIVAEFSTWFSCWCSLRDAEVWDVLVQTGLCIYILWNTLLIGLGIGRTRRTRPPCLTASFLKMYAPVTTLVLFASTVLRIAGACSSRSTPKPRPPSPTLRPNITFPTYACPPAYATWYCLNGATCFTVEISESILYNCVCADGYTGPRCEFKDLDGSYLPSREKVMVEKASIAGGVTVAVLLIVILSIAVYIYSRRRKKEKSIDRVDLRNGTTNPERPFNSFRSSQRFRDSRISRQSDVEAGGGGGGVSGGGNARKDSISTLPSSHPNVSSTSAIHVTSRGSPP